MCTAQVTPLLQVSELEKENKILREKLTGTSKQHHDTLDSWDRARRTTRQRAVKLMQAAVLRLKHRELNHCVRSWSMAAHRVSAVPPPPIDPKLDERLKQYATERDQLQDEITGLQSRLRSSEAQVGALEREIEDADTRHQGNRDLQATRHSMQGSLM